MESLARRGERSPPASPRVCRLRLSCQTLLFLIQGRNTRARVYNTAARIILAWLQVMLFSFDWHCVYQIIVKLRTSVVLSNVKQHNRYSFPFPWTPSPPSIIYQWCQRDCEQSLHPSLGRKGADLWLLQKIISVMLTLVLFISAF